MLVFGGVVDTDFPVIIILHIHLSLDRWLVPTNFPSLGRRLPHFEPPDFSRFKCRKPIQRLDWFCPGWWFVQFSLNKTHTVSCTHTHTTLFRFPNFKKKGSSLISHYPTKVYCFFCCPIFMSWVRRLEQLPRPSNSAIQEMAKSDYAACTSVTASTTALDSAKYLGRSEDIG